MSNIEIAQSYLQAAYSGNLEQAGSFLADDVQLVLAGKNNLSGVYRGKNEFFGAFASMMQQTGGSYRLDQQYAWLEGTERAVLFAQESTEKDGHKRVFDRVLEYYIQNNKIQRIRVYEGNPEVADAAF